jgi:hypothetical protein
MDAFDIPSRRRAGSLVSLLAIATGLTLAMAGPVLRHPTVRLFGSEIVGRHHDPFTVIAQFEQPRVPGLFTQPATDYLGAVFAGISGDGVIAYNLVVLASFPLAALFAYLLALRLTRSLGAAWLAALAYAFAPFHVAHAAYHPHVAQTQWLPLYFLALLLCLDRATLARLVLLVTTAGLVVLSNFYFGLIAAVLTPVALLAFWYFESRQSGDRPWRGLWITAVTLTAIALVGSGYVLLVAPQVLHEPQSLAFAREDLFLYSARSESYLIPPVEHPLLGAWARSFWERQEIDGGLVEQQVTIGIGLLLLAAVSVLSWLRGGRDNRQRAVPILLILAAFAFLFSLSPRWQLGSVAFTRPSGFLYELLPMFRAYARFGVVLLLAVATLAGMGAVLLWRRQSRGATVAASLLVLLAALELAPFPPWRWRDVLPTSAHRWLAGQPEPLRILDCVPRSSPGERTVLRLFGSGRIALLRGSEDCGDPDFVAKLATEGYTHVILRRASPLGQWLGDHTTPEGLQRLRSFEEAWVLAVTAEPPPVYLEIHGGFHWREYQGARTYRWMADRGSLTVVHTGDVPLEVRFQLELNSFPTERALGIAFDGLPMGELVVSTDPSRYELGPLAVTPGRHRLDLVPRTPAVIADEIRHNGDLRPLTVALGSWSLSFDKEGDG